MGFKEKWEYRRTVDRAVRDTNYDARSILTMAMLIGFPLGLIFNREMPGILIGALLLPLPVLYYFTFYRWHLETRHGKQGFRPSVRVTVGKGTLHLDDGKSRAGFDLEDIRELAAFIPEKDGASRWLLILVLEGMEYVLPSEAEGIEDLLREFRDDQVFDTFPVDRPDIKPGRWTIWEKEGAG